MSWKSLLKKTVIWDIWYWMRYRIEDIKQKDVKSFFEEITILDDDQTIEKIVKEKKSIARFGDGEFKWIMGDSMPPSFQENNVELSNRLKQVILSNKEQVLIGIPRNLKYVKNARNYDKWFWRRFVNQYGERIKKYMKPDRVYGNTNVTRFYMGYKDKENTIQRVQQLQKIWRRKKAINC